MKIFVFAISILILISATYSQSPWIQPVNNLYSQISVNVIPEYDIIYLRDGMERHLPRKLSDITVQAWFEYGFLPATTAIFSLPYKILKAGDAARELNSPPVTKSGSFSAPGTIEFGVRHSLLTRRVIVSGQVLFELKTSQYDMSTGLRSGYDAWGIAPLLSLGYSKEDFYTFVYSGTGFRSNNYSSFFRGGFESGYKIIGQLWIAGFIDIVHSFRNGSYTPSVTNFSTVFYIDEQEYVAWGIKAIISLAQNNYGIVATLAGAATGNNVAKSPSINLGFFYKFNSF